MEKIAKQYFNAWNNRDLDKLRSIFSSSVTLEDWEISKKGIEDVIEANKGIFENVPEIKAIVKNTAIGPKQVMAELKIQLDQNQSIDVVDILTIENDLITSIKAYKK